MSTNTLGIPLNELSERAGFYPQWILNFHSKYGLFTMTTKLNIKTKKMEQFFPEETLQILSDVRKLGKYGMRIELIAEFVRNKEFYLYSVEKLTANRLTTDLISQIAQQAQLPHWEQFLFDNVFLQRISPLVAIQNTGIDVATPADLQRYCYSVVRLLGTVILYEIYMYLNPGEVTYTDQDFAAIPFVSFDRLSKVTNDNLFSSNPLPLIGDLDIEEIEKIFLLGILKGESSTSLAKKLRISERSAKEAWHSLSAQVGWLFLYPHILKDETYN